MQLDDEALQALRRLEASGLSRSEAVRQALINDVRRLDDHKALAAESVALEDDVEDRAEMLLVAGLMGQLGVTT